MTRQDHALSFLLFKCWVLLMLVSLATAECPCMHCGPPMCKAVCMQDCYKCCECCVFFENRVGKRSGNDHQVEQQEQKEDNQESLCLFKRHLQSAKKEKSDENAQQLLRIPDVSDIAEAMSLRLSILRASEDRLKHGSAENTGTSSGLEKFLTFLRQAAKSRET